MQSVPHRIVSHAPVSLSRKILLVLLLASLAGCGGIDTRPAATAEAPAFQEQVPEIMPGVLQGYLSKADQLDSRNFVPPAPSQHSARQAFDTAWSEKMLPLRGSARWDLAIRDADLSFPATASTFSCALGIPVTKEDTPALYMLLRRTLADLGLATYSAKKVYQRERPFMTNGKPVCTPEEETTLRKDGSYPSGHTAVGWGWALILSELAPDRAEAILARGRAFGESRNVCNVHWYSDVVAGRTVGSAAVARLHANEAFLAAREAARADIDRARRDGLTPQHDCAPEAAALATVF
ncbi:MAG: phosphatase PAP2 family protein [Pseudomonadota bacterium]|nr:phosphatase PAP2 family protein [Pseudomonadota bacterium]